MPYAIFDYMGSFLRNSFAMFSKKNENQYHKIKCAAPSRVIMPALSTSRAQPASLYLLGKLCMNCRIIRGAADLVKSAALRNWGTDTAWQDSKGLDFAWDLGTEALRHCNDSKELWAESANITLSVTLPVFNADIFSSPKMLSAGSKTITSLKALASNVEPSTHLKASKWTLTVDAAGSGLDISFETFTLPAFLPRLQMEPL